MILHNIDVSDIPSIDGMSANIVEDGFKKYFNLAPGNEHYRLLSYISNKYNRITILDIGTFKGYSAFAFSSNENNIIYSIDINDCNPSIIDIPSNIEFLTGNIMDSKYDHLIDKSSIILIDINHDGDSEKLIIDKLDDIGYNGVVLMDDIYLNSNMKLLWESITHIKYDITHIGHVTGTGLIYYGDQNG